MNVELTLGFIRQFGARYSSFTVRRSICRVRSSAERGDESRTENRELRTEHEHELSTENGAA